MESSKITVEEYLKFLSAKGIPMLNINWDAFIVMGVGFSTELSTSKIFYELASQNHSGSQYKLGLLYHRSCGVLRIIMVGIL